MDNSEVRFDLIENGLDFIASGVKHILEDREYNSLKYAVIHLMSGTELIFKEVLKGEHWSLIFDTISSAKLELLEMGEFKSADFESLIIRLENICGVVIDPKDRKNLKRLRNFRNRIEHFQFSLNVPEIRSTTSKLLSFLLSFINRHIKAENMSDDAKECLESLRGTLRAFEEFVKVRNAQIKDEIQKAEKLNHVDICPKCLQRALVIREPISCLFCGFSDTAENVAILYAENVLNESAHLSAIEGGSFSVVDCPDCGSADTLVDIERYFLCFNCCEVSYKPDMRYCSSCEEVFRSQGLEEELCENCIQNLY